MVWSLPSGVVFEVNLVVAVVSVDHAVRDVMWRVGGV
jgi:hypothetical protein